MTRETKIGLVVASSFLILVGVVVANKMRPGGNNLVAQQPSPENKPPESPPPLPVEAPKEAILQAAAVVPAPINSAPPEPQPFLKLPPDVPPLSAPIDFPAPKPIASDKIELPPLPNFQEGLQNANAAINAQAQDVIGKIKPPAQNASNKVQDLTDMIAKQKTQLEDGLKNFSPPALPDVPIVIAQNDKPSSPPPSLPPPMPPSGFQPPALPPPGDPTPKPPQGVTPPKPNDTGFAPPIPPPGDPFNKPGAPTLPPITDINKPGGPVSISNPGNPFPNVDPSKGGLPPLKPPAGNDPPFQPPVPNPQGFNPPTNGNNSAPPPIGNPFDKPAPPIGNPFDKPAPPIGSQGPSTPPPPLPNPNGNFPNNNNPAGTVTPLPNTNTPAPRVGDPVIGGIPMPQVSEDRIQPYLVKDNDRDFEEISRQVYGDPKYGRALWAFNRQYPLASNDLKGVVPRLGPGTKVYFPSKDHLTRQFATEFNQLSPQAIWTGTSNMPNGGTPFQPPVIGSNQPTNSPTPFQPPVIGSTLPPNPNSNPTQPPFQPPVAIGSPNPNNQQPKTPAPMPPANANVRDYRVAQNGELIQDIAKQQLGSPARWWDIYRLNPGLQPAQKIPANTVLRLPATP